MISLTLKAQTDDPSLPPFVVRLLTSTDGCAVEADDAVLDYAEESGGLVFTTERTKLRIFGIDAKELHNDVVLVSPQRGTVRRLIRAASRHNSLLVTEQCDQLCVMCSQPPKARHVDYFPFLAAAARLAPDNSILGITGGEPTLHKAELFAFLERALADRPDLRFRVLTNAQHFDDADADFLARNRTSVVWGIPLYAPTAALHDEIVGKQGAFATFERALSLMARLGAQIELRTVVMASNVEALPSLAHFVTTRLPFVGTWALMQLENIGFGRQNWGELFHDSGRAFDAIATALDIAAARGPNTLLFNFPLCTIPTGYRRRAVATVSDWKRKYLPTCGGCRLRQDCGGFFEWYPEGRGFARLGLQ